MWGAPTKSYQGDYTTRTPNKGEAIELDEGMSEARPVHPGRLVEPVVFQPKLKIRLSRSTYKVNSYVDFGPYRESFKKFDSYIHNPDYVGALADLNRGKAKEQTYIVIIAGCKSSTYG